MFFRQTDGRAGLNWRAGGRTGLCESLLWVGFVCCVVVNSFHRTAIGNQIEAADVGQAERDFEQVVRPIFVEHCQECHGAKKQEAGLRLDSQSALLKGGDSGSALNLEFPDQSRLLEAVRYEGDLQMPPRGKLSPREIESLEKWVLQGAYWPEPAAVTGPEVKQRDQHWAFQPISRPSVPDVNHPSGTLHPIDRFVLAKLQVAGLAESSPADRRTLIRRMTYDLTGLPPTLAEVEAFEADSGSDQEAISRLLERLLESPEYGEHWARHWLDIARYSDTKGYVYAREQANFVHAQHYRDWVINAFQQDLPYDQFLLLQIAADQASPDMAADWAAMGFLTLGRRFIGVSRDIIDDRIDVVTRGTMGLSVACARCHDHKYDPIPTADYYSLYGVFQNCYEDFVPLKKSDKAAGDANEPLLAEFRTRQSQFESLYQKRKQEAADRARARVTDYLIAQTELKKYPAEGFDQVLASDAIIPARVRRWEMFLANPAREHDPIFRPWVLLSRLSTDGFAERAEQVLAELAAEAPEAVNQSVLAALSATPSSMQEVAERYGQLFANVQQEIKESATSGGERPVSESVVDGKPESFVSEDVRKVLYGPESPCEFPPGNMTATEHLFDSATCDELWKSSNELDSWLLSVADSFPVVMPLIDRPSNETAYILKRGNPKTRGSAVTRHFLTAIAGDSPKPFELGSGRLELARAIVSPQNPLTARVWVNRIWQHHFGQGLVATPSDFGVRAAPPSHPELLDWLATQLIDSGWSTKSIHRLIMTSRTYQQSAFGPENPADVETALKVDPGNQLLWRAGTHRLTFEEFRDSLLHVASRLDGSVGGRPTDLWTAQSNGTRRRTLYCRIDRQFLPTLMKMFDFANPDLHIPQRSETIVPQQSLFALNHPFIAEIAKTVAASVMAEQLQGNEQQLVERLYQRVYQRLPQAAELATATGFLRSVSQPESNDQPRAESLAWEYGWGELNEATGKINVFQALPYFSLNGWQGAASYPADNLGWLQLTATGGHPGNDHAHAVIRRWKAPYGGEFSVTSTIKHQHAVGNGVRAFVVSSSGGIVASADVHNRHADLSIPLLTLGEGDTIDFVVHINGDLNTDQFLWAPRIACTSDPVSPGQPTLWDSEQDFRGPLNQYLSRLEQLTQVLLISNEFLFVE